MTNQRIKHILGLLATLAMTVLPLWGDPAQTLAARIAGTLATGLLLFVRTDDLATSRNAILGGLAMAGVLVAGIAGRFSAGSAGIEVVGIVAAVLTQLRAILGQRLPVPATDSTEKETKPNVIPIATIIFALASLAGQQARATPQAIGCIDTADTYCVVPASAVGWQLNLKDGGVKNGVVLAGLVMQHEFGTIPLGLGLYAGLGASTANQSSYQGCAGISVTNFGMVCVGAQRATFTDGATAWQGMLTFAGQLTFGGTPAYVRSSVAAAKGAP